MAYGFPSVRAPKNAVVVTRLCEVSIATTRAKTCHSLTTPNASTCRPRPGRTPMSARDGWS